VIASMLGMRREGVTAAVQQLQKLGLIHCTRGHIAIVDRRGLEQRVCECYSYCVTKVVFRFAVRSAGNDRVDG
jgi:Mn-dependent DtxR family transcriptional regulator